MYLKKVTNSQSKLQSRRLLKIISKIDKFSTDETKKAEKS